MVKDMAYAPAARRLAAGACALALAGSLALLAGCAAQDDASTQGSGQATSAADTGAARASGTALGTSSASSSIASVDDMPNATVRFGSGGQAFTFVPEANETALALMRNVTDAGRNLPIYTYEGFEGDDVMQYYDVPSRYEASADPQHVTSERAGEVYLSSPNRVILFYNDADIEGDFTYVGRIEDTAGLAEAVVGNPVVQGYTNKIVSISYASEA